MTFAEELNKAEVAAGIEDGHLWLADENDEPKKVGPYTILQTNSGPDLGLSNGKLVLAGYHEDQDKCVWASFDQESYEWSDA